MADFQSRNGAFASVENRGLSPSLEEAAERFNSQAPHSYRPESTLAQLGPSLVAANATAKSMQDRVLLGNQIAPNTQIGSSPESAQAAMLLRMRGQDEA